MDDEDIARMTAIILGPASAAARALDELDRRRAAGQDARIVDFQNRWVVASPSQPLPASGGDTPTKDDKHE